MAFGVGISCARGAVRHLGGALRGSGQFTAIGLQPWHAIAPAYGDSGRSRGLARPGAGAGSALPGSTLRVGPAGRYEANPADAANRRLSSKRETNVGRVIRCAVLAAVAAGCLSASVSGAGEYPLALTLDMKAGNATATVTTSVTIRVDRAMEPNRWTRVTDALKYNGYGAFLNTLRTLPAIGGVDIGKRHVDLRYSHEEPAAEGRRLILVADRPMFFIAADESKSKAGYELTIV